MLELEEAVARILAAVPPSVGERVALPDAHGRILAERISAPIDLPPFDNSSMDGYAVRAADVAEAKPDVPVCLRIVGRVAAGETFAGGLTEGACVRLFTGSPLPRGADAIVMQEETRLEPERSNEVLILDSVKAWENVRFRGEDVKRGALLIEAGEALTGARLSLLAAMGLSHVHTGRRPIVGLLATGSELKEGGESLAPGQIYESNRAGLAPLIKKAGGIPAIFGIVPDDLTETRCVLDRAFAECDAVITCGGVSVGEMDFVKAAFQQSGGSLEFWKVAIKPGRPFVFGRLGGKFLFGLPGNPVSALVTFLLLVRPALLRWQGGTALSLPASSGLLLEPLVNSGGRRHFVRVMLDARGNVRSAGTQASHLLSSLAAANGLVDLLPETTFAVGTFVPVLRWE
jgi:molybdopterin molybdotransferase